MRGAGENNLRGIDVDCPRDAVVAFTGVSGSGKSSLAFGTIYAEAQRRYLESVAPYARRLIQQGHTPHVGSITGLPPAVALQQRRGTPSVRSTVGTLTTISNSPPHAVLTGRNVSGRCSRPAGVGCLLTEHGLGSLSPLPRPRHRPGRDGADARPGPVPDHP
ncbi:hypothetical protein MN0502_27230 [Arthrobacter sp. MN05-02]|nr:hypothetical protein MN0502_27230 [Arthrobacter sp. MN05-02]